MNSNITLFDLPNETLAHAARYLARPSRALFSIALFGHEPEARDSELCEAILGVRLQWGILDFGKEIEESLAAKLTDDDLRVILLSVAAGTNLKKMKLTGCINITGAGLSPLRGSAVLQQIDLSLVAEHKSPVLDTEPLLSCEHVLPILDSIIEREESVLHSITFPESWRREENVVLNEFMRRCNEMFVRRNITCPTCDESVEEIDVEWFLLHDPSQGDYYGLQEYTCYNCLGHFCHGCEDEEDLNYCCNCKKHYCNECVSIEECVKCDKSYCKGCKFLEKCVECDEYYCKDCQSLVNCGGSQEGRGLLPQCKKKFCEDCITDPNRLSGECEKCDIPFCDDCWGFYGCECNRGYCANCHKSDGDRAFCDQCGSPLCRYCDTCLGRCFM